MPIRAYSAASTRGCSRASALSLRDRHGDVRVRLARAALLVTLLMPPTMADAKRPKLELRFVGQLGPWSPAVDGLRGRLVASPYTAAKGRTQMGLALDLENTGDAPIDLVWGDPGELVKFDLADEKGAPVPPEHPGGNSIVGPPTRKSVAPKKSIRLPLSKGAYEYVALERVLLRPFAFQAWFLPSAGVKLQLRADLVVPEDQKKGARPSWHGTLALPAVLITTP